MRISLPIINRFKQIILKNKTFFLAMHLNPDADACGSMLSMYCYLKSLNKKVYLFSSDKLPENLYILPHSSKINSEMPKKNKFDVGIFFECSTPDRAGSKISELNFKYTISIDHHKTATKYATLNILDFKSPSTSEIIYRLFKQLKFKIDKNIAILLYAGIITDTGKFHYPQTTPQTHIIVSELLKYRFNFSKINDNFFLRTTYQNLKLLGRAIENMELYDEKIAILILKQKDFEEFKAGFEHTENIVNFPMMLDSVEVSVLIKEDKERYNVTFRSKEKVDVSKIALTFGGGGHRNASGFKISRKKILYNELKDKILIEIKKQL